MTKRIGIDFTVNPTPLTDTWLQLWVQLAGALPDHRFYFLFESTPVETEATANNIEVIVLPAPTFSVLGKRSARKKILEQQLKALDIPTWVTTVPENTVSLHIVQVLYINEMNHPKELKAAIHKASTLTTKTPVTWQCWAADDDLVQQLELPVKTSVATLPYADCIAPMSWTEATAIKVQYAAGNDYFLYAPEVFEETACLNVLKGFSLFKKWQQSSMHLILLLPKETLDITGFKAKLESYKYKSAVQIVSNIPPKSLMQLIGASYALITVSTAGNHLNLIWQAAASGVPVITSHLPRAANLLGEKVLYAAAHLPDEMGKQLIVLYKDETLRSDLIAQMQAAVGHQQPALVTKQWMQLLQNI